MSGVRRRQPTHPPPSEGCARECAELRARLAEAEETLHAIRSGEVDALVVGGEEGARVFTLEGAEHAYRLLIESMNEGALTLASDATILYANRCFSGMVKLPMEQVTGGSLCRFLSAGDRAALRPLLKRAVKSGSKIEVMLHAGDGSELPAQISTRALAKDGTGRATIGVVVTDLTGARRAEELLRALSHRLVQAQESERGRVAVELHDHITQLLCAVLFRCRALADKLPARDGPGKAEALKLCEMVGKTAEEVERISRNLRPSVLDEMGLVAVLRAAGAEFTARTSVPLKLSCVRLTDRLPADVEVTLYRIFQEALRNVEEHACARHVAVLLGRKDGFVRLVIGDDGIGFSADRRPLPRVGAGGLGLLSMRERATYVGGTLDIQSSRRTGTEIDVRIPVPPDAPPAGGRGQRGVVGARRQK
jgi:two-component system, NarL family, sensor kinase